jgi:polyisoprenoid-binding protein YceI
VITYRLGPEDGTLAVRTQRTGAAAKAGHNLLIHALRWQATIELDAVTHVEVEVDGSSLRVVDGQGGMQALQDEDKENIERTIQDEVLRGERVEFRSLDVKPKGAGLRVDGELTLNGVTHPLGFDLDIGGDGELSAVAVVKQTDWGMKPYSGLFGALKVVDEVEVAIEAKLPPAQSL